MPRVTLFSRATHPTVIAVVALGITQIIAWGTSFYALAVLAKPIMADTGWSNASVYGGFTIAVLASSLISTPAGMAIDRFGARGVMTIGFAGLAASLYALSLANDVWQYFAVWAVMGLAMRLTLYDAAFAAIVQVDAANGRRAIAYLTLFGGLASTAGWPAGHWLNEAVGWRDTFAIFALVNLIACVPLAWFGLPKQHQRASAETADNNERAGATAPLIGSSRLIAMVLFSIVMSANAFVFGVGAIHLVGLLEASAGVAVATAVALASLKGVAQVAGRIWELVFGRYVSPMMLGRLAIGLLPLAFVVLFAFSGAIAALVFVLIFGVSNGLVTVVRGAVPLALFGAQGYGTILGILATPILLVNAISPLAFAKLVDAFGYGPAAWTLLGIGLAGLAAMEILAIWYRRVTAERAA